MTLSVLVAIAAFVTAFFPGAKNRAVSSILAAVACVSLLYVPGSVAQLRIHEQLTYNTDIVFWRIPFLGLAHVLSLRFTRQQLSFPFRRSLASFR